MNRREKVINALEFRPSKAMDLGGMLSTGISCFAYPALVKALGLPPRLPKVHDSFQMLALPDADVLDALDCDVATVGNDSWTNAFEEPQRWHPYDFGGRLPALVRNPSAFEELPDGTIMQNGESMMVPGAYVFDLPHGGEPLDLSGQDLPLEDPDELRNHLADTKLSDSRIASIAAYCKRARESTDRAIMFNGPSMQLGFRGGMAAWSMVCLTEADHVHEIHGILAEHAIETYQRLIPAIAPYVDIIMANADDQGTQNAPILPPSVFKELYVPYYRRMNDAIHAAAPRIKTFLHSCGAVYPLIEHIIDAGFDVLNPVQWPAGSQGYRKWKDLARNRIALWGGGINSQATLPLGTLDEIATETAETTAYMAQDGGYVFNSIHNILAEISPDRVITMYQSAAKAYKKLDLA